MRRRLLILLVFGPLLIPAPRLLAQGRRDPKAPVIDAIRHAKGDVSWFTTPDGLRRRASFGYGPVSAENLNLLKQLDHLHTLDVHWPRPKLDDKALRALGELTDLHALSINAHQFRDDDLKPLANLTDLQELTLRGVQVTDTGLEFLDGLTKLQKLDLSGATRVTGAGLSHLEGLIELRELSLGSTRVDDAGLAHLAPLRRLQSLNLPGTPIHGPGLAHLDGLAELTELSLNKALVDDDGLKRLGPAKQVRLVDVTNTAVTPAPLRNPAAGLALKTEGLVARVIDSATGKDAGAVFRHEANRGGSTITCWAISPDGRLVATGSSYRSHLVSADENMGTLWIWDAATGHRKASRGRGSILWVAFRPDSKTVLFQAEPYEVDGP